MKKLLIVAVASITLAASMTFAEAQSGGGASGEGAIGGGTGAPGGGTGIPGAPNFGLTISPIMMSAINELAAEQARTMRQYGHMMMTPRMRHAINVIAAEQRKMRRRHHH